MKRIICALFVLISSSVYAGYNVPYPVVTSGLNTLHFALQSIFKSTYNGPISTQQEHFIGYVQYGFLNILDIGITANYHIVDIKTPINKERQLGIGDSTLYGRLYIFGNKWIDLGLKCDLNVPLGNENFTAHTFTHNSILISEFNLIYFRPYITFGHYTINKTNGYFRFNFGIQKMIVPAWIPFVDIYTEVSQKGDDEQIPCWVVLGSIIKIKEHALRIEYIINTKEFSSEKGFFALRYMYNFK